MRSVAPAVVATLAVLGSATAARADTQPTRYSLANGCYTVQDASGQTVAPAERVRMQATTLGRYLLYRQDGTFVAARGDGTIVPAATPSEAADWRVDDVAGGTFTLTPMSAQNEVLTAGAGGTGRLTLPGDAGGASRLHFAPADGCATYPDAELDATGTPSKGQVPYERVRGLLEGHMHWMTFEYFGGNFHCGRPWHPYGIAFALPDCSAIEGTRGTAAPFQNSLNFGNPVAPHDTRGYPALTAWGPGNLTYEGTYWRWIQRAWMAGLRLMVMSVNENRVLCELEVQRKTNCDEMDTVRRGFADIHELQRYVDAQAGGPGKGFFQIVTDPYQARRVINEGKMAVVLEIEVSELFGCRGWSRPSCDQAQVDRGLDEVHRLGVRSLILQHKFDNPFGGVRFDGGPLSPLINGANWVSTGTFWSARTCPTPLADNTIETPVPQGISGFLDQALSTLGVPRGSVPAYPPPPHCNTRGLTALGAHVVRRMMDMHMIVNPDHMSQAAVADTLTLLEARHYSGVISPHGWMDPGNWPRLWKLGGIAFPGHSAASDYIKEWRRYRPKSTSYAFGWGYGADLGGLSHQPRTDPAVAITYPFKSYDGAVTFERQRTGDRTFDYNKDGVAQYGLYADWFEALRRLGGEQFVKDMLNGAEAYLEMWERAEGIASPGCARQRGALTSRGRGALRLGQDWQALLRRAGQPQQRTRAWSWCVSGTGNRHAADVAVLSDAGKVQLVGSTARGRSAGGVKVGTAASRLAGTPRVAAGLRLRRSGKATWVYAVSKGSVRAVAVASPSLGRRTAALRTAMNRVRSAKATQALPTYQPSQAEAQLHGRLVGRTLAGTGDPRLDAGLAMLCSLQGLGV